MAFEKLKKGEGNSFFITKYKNFEPLYDLSDKAELVFEFAFEMTFGKTGEHREYRTGGQTRRKNGELFINTFQGKLAEFGVYKFFSEKKFALTKPELGMWKRGVWDSVDLIINSKKINVKSVAFFSSLLLLERDDWDSEAKYIPNKESGDDTYDYFILTRIKPDGKGIMRSHKLFYSDKVEKEKLKKIILGEKWMFDIVGFCTRDEIKSVIEQEFILPQNALLNGKTKMDAENYYCQAGDMGKTNDLVSLLS